MKHRAPKKSTTKTVKKLIASATEAASPSGVTVKVDGRSLLTIADAGGAYVAVGASYKEALELAAHYLRAALAKGIKPHLAIRVSETADRYACE